MKNKRTNSDITQLERLKLAFLTLQGSIELEQMGEKRDAYINAECALEQIEQFIETYLNENEIKSANVEDVKK